MVFPHCYEAARAMDAGRVKICRMNLRRSVPGEGSRGRHRAWGVVGSARAWSAPRVGLAKAGSASSRERVGQPMGTDW